MSAPASATSSSRTGGPQPGPRDFRLGRWMIGPGALLRVALFAAGLAYLQTVTYGFVYDDFPQIVVNPWVHSFKHWRELLGTGVWSFGSGLGNYYRPVFTVWLAGNYAMFHSMPGWWHLASIAAHVLVTALVYLLAVRLLGNRWTAAVAALLFGLNPVHVECVAWISAVPEVLLAIFFIGAFLAFERWRETRRARWIAVSTLLYVLALFSKETGMAFLPVLAVWVWTRGGSATNGDRRSTLYSGLAQLAPYGVVTVAYFAARAHALGQLANSNYPRPWTWVVATWPSALWLYLRAMLWPFPPRPAYELDLVRHFSFTAVVMPVAGAALVLAFLAWAGRKHGLGRLTLAWIVMPLAPVLIGIHVFQWHDYAHDRYAYVPSVIVAIVLASALEQFAEWAGNRKVQVAVISVLALAFAATVVAANRSWQSDTALFLSSYEHAPGNPLAAADAAMALYEAGRTQESVARLQSLVAAHPDYWEGNYILGLTYYRLGRDQDAEKYLTVATRVWPLEFIRPDGAQYYYLALAQLHQGEDQPAEAALRKAIEWQPHALSYHFALATLLEKQGRHAEAQEQLRMEAGNRRLYGATQKNFAEH